jgi:Recombinase
VFHDAETFAWMQEQRARGYSYEEIAEALNAAEIPTARGGRWQGNTVRRILLRTTPRNERQVA